MREKRQGWERLGVPPNSPLFVLFFQALDPHRLSFISPSHSSAVTGGPADWAAATQALDVVRAAAANRDARVVVAVFGRGGDEEGGEAAAVTSGSGDQASTLPPPPALPEDRLAGLCRQGCIDPARVIVLGLDEGGAAGLRRLGRAAAAAAGEHYAADADRRVAACAARATAAAAANGAATAGTTTTSTTLTPTPPPPAAVGRAALKAGALAEFRGDWAGAVREYLAAHGALVAAAGGGVGAPPPPPPPSACASWAWWPRWRRPRRPPCSTTSAGRARRPAWWPPMCRPLGCGRPVRRRAWPRPQTWRPAWRRTCWRGPPASTPWRAG